MNNRVSKDLAPAPLPGAVENVPVRPGGDVRAMFVQAASSYQAGRRGEAQAVCRRILELAPEEPNALNLLGALAFDFGDAAQAAAMMDRALKVAGGRVDFLINRAQIHQRLGEFGQAEDCLRRAMAVSPGEAGILGRWAALMRQMGRLDEAEAAFRKALGARPESVEFMNDLGLVLLEKKNLPEAEKVFRQALSIRQEFPEAHYNLGLVLKELARLDEAEASYLRALAWRGDYPDGLNNLGNLLQGVGRLGEAKAFLRKAVALQPDNAQMLNNYGTLLADLGENEEAERLLTRAQALGCTEVASVFRLGMLMQGKNALAEAEAYYRQVLARDGNHIQALNNLGLVLMKLRHLDEAQACFRQVLSMNPGENTALINLSVVLDMLGRPDEGAMILEHDALQYESALGKDAAYNKGVMLLRQGRLIEGWKGYENRLQSVQFKSYFCELPIRPWQGEPLDEKRILLIGEQGRGDQIQFIRYAEVLRQMGATVVDLVTWPDLVELMASAPGLGQVHTGPQISLKQDAYDYSCFLMSVPGLVGTDVATIPAKVPYLRANPEAAAKWKSRLDAESHGGKFRVGLVWAGNPEHSNDRLRSMRLELLRPVLAVEGTEWYSLQKGAAEGALQEFVSGGCIVHAHGPDLTSFMDTAALIENLDLLIGVDTSVVHVAGALGKPTWTLLPTNSDWRWMMDRSDSPWYPTMRLFRQDALGDWDGVVERVREALVGVVSPPLVSEKKKPARGGGKRAPARGK